MNFMSLFKSKSKETNQLSNYMDVVVSLNQKLEIDLSVFLKEDNISILNNNDYALVYAEFIHNTFSDNIKEKIISILDSQIKNTSNANFINMMILYLNYFNYENKKNTTPSNNQIFIRPSQVFTKYS